MDLIAEMMGTIVASLMLRCEAIASRRFGPCRCKAASYEACEYKAAELRGGWWKVQFEIMLALPSNFRDAMASRLNDLDDPLHDG